VQEITAASREQDTGGEQINKALQQLEKVIQQNASASEELAATTEELTGQSDQLVKALAFFHTGDESHHPVQRTGTANTVRHPAELVRRIEGISHAPPSEAAAEAMAGVALRLKEKHGGLDAEFERY
jgi:methyl-accepting chemotaxis protein